MKSETLETKLTELVAHDGESVDPSVRKVASADWAVHDSVSVESTANEALLGKPGLHEAGSSDSTARHANSAACQAVIAMWLVYKEVLADVTACHTVWQDRRCKKRHWRSRRDAMRCQCCQ